MGLGDQPRVAGRGSRTRASLSATLVAALLACSSTPPIAVAGTEGGCKGNGCTKSSTGLRIGGTSSASSATSSLAGSRGSSTSGGTSGSAATTGSGSSSASTAPSSGSSSGESSSGGVDGTCLSPTLPDGGGCPNGSFVSTLVDFLTCAPLGGATIQALDHDGVPTTASVISAPDGTFVLCAPSGTSYTPFATATGYPTLYLNEVQGGVNNVIPGVAVPSRTDLAAISALLPEGVESSQGAVAVTIAQSACSNRSGWSFALEYSDGGAIPDGGELECYMGTGLPDPSLKATVGGGTVFFYNIDTSATNFFGVTYTNPDAGKCVPAATSYPTGRLYVAADSFTVDVLQVLP